VLPYALVSRLMVAEDMLLYASAKEGRAAALAANLARRHGLRGKAMDAAVMQILHRDAPSRQVFEQQARR
jgi:hypothetical protein